jgi:hypothetical protein
MYLSCNTIYEISTGGVEDSSLLGCRAMLGCVPDILIDHSAFISRVR